MDCAGGSTHIRCTARLTKPTRGGSGARSCQGCPCAARRLRRSADDSLTATALGLEARFSDGAVEQAVLLSCDLAQESFKADLIGKLGSRCPDLDQQRIAVSAMHTHTAPPLESGMYEEPEHDREFMTLGEYRGLVAERTDQAVADAWEGASARRHLARLRLCRGRALPACHTECHFIRLGDVAIATNPFDRKRAGPGGRNRCRHR